MKFFTRELLTMTTILVAAYLILVHSTGFSRSIRAAAESYGGIVRDLQGRRR